MTKITGHVGFDEGGYHVCFVRERDGAESYWYGSREDCHRVAVERPLPRGQRFYRPRTAVTSLMRHEAHADNR